MKVTCAGCGDDCSRAYGTHNGLPYHFGCFPMPQNPKRHPDAPPRPPKRPQTLAEAERQWNSEHQLGEKA